MEDVFINGAFNLINHSIKNAQQITEQWNSIWETLLTGVIWNSLVVVALGIATACVLYLAIKSGKEITEKQDWNKLLEIFIPPLIVAILLTPNAPLLPNTLLEIRTLAYKELNKVLDFQATDLTLKQAITNNNITLAAQQEILNLFAPCQDLSSPQLYECYAENREAALEILTAAEETANSPLTELQAFVEQFTILDDIIESGFNPVRILSQETISLISTILYAFQTAFVYGLEIALLLTALYCPIAIALTLVTNGKSILSWLIGILSLFGMQLGYNIIVGVVTAVIVSAESILSTEIALAIFLSFFAPAIAILIAGGGGVALYRGILNNIAAIINVTSILTAGATRPIVRALRP